MNKEEQYRQDTALGGVRVAVTRHVIDTPLDMYVPYEGGNALVKAAFPNGFPASYGSGLAFKGRAANGDLEFYCLTDRGPNGDGPNVPSLAGGATTVSKIFPAPGFTPSIGVVHVSADGAQLRSSVPIRHAPDQQASGLPIPPDAIGNSAEIPVFDDMCFDITGKAIFHAGGIDSEALAFDRKRNVRWVTDEYGPFLLKIDPGTGLITQRYAPGAGLPEILARRRANRGMEGMTLDPASDRIHAFLQSPLSEGKAHYALTGRDEKIERYARFLRWIEFDPASGATTRMFAYPLEPMDFAEGRTGNAKLGDVVALGDGKFIVIEQGEGPNGYIFNLLMLVEIAAATDIATEVTSDLERSSMSGTPVNNADWSAVVPLKKSVLLNLNRIGWVAEKAEGLALVDACTLAMTNDNDFGMKTRVYDAAGAELEHADVSAFEVDAKGVIVAGSAATDVIRVGRVAEQERPLSLWLLKFNRPLSSYGT